MSSMGSVVGGKWYFVLVAICGLIVGWGLVRDCVDEDKEKDTNIKIL